MKTLGLIMAISGSLAFSSASAVQVERYSIELPPEAQIAYQGAFAKEFPLGIPTGLGSGLAFAGKQSDGSFLFYSVTDRGPNGDAPLWFNGKEMSPTKIFLAPKFTPQIMQVRIADGKAVASHAVLLNDQQGSINGLPLPAGLIGSTSETALSDAFKPLTEHSERGLDTEGLVSDGNDGFWLCDEYGPFLIHVDARGKILAKYGPSADQNEKAIASGLPNILKWRQPNRGFEGIARLPSGKIIAAIQSTLDVDGKTAKKAAFIRLLELDPATGSTRMYAYPYDLDVYKKNSDAKIGDLVALDDQRLLIIEQGKDANKKMRNLVYMIDLKNATDLTDKQFDHTALEFAPDRAALEKLNIHFVTKQLVLDLREHGWSAEKAEGLTIIDNQTIAVASDNDFGLSVKVKNKEGDAKSPDDYAIDGKGQVYLDDKPVKTHFVIEATDGDEAQSQLWLFKLDKPLK
jgi:hypothetical protein